jgi:branched-chain amino acid transport system permease protein
LTETRESFWLRYGRAIAIALFLAAAVVVPVVVRSPYHLSIITFIGIYAIIAIGLCLLMGYAGQISLGHAAFFGLGAYTSALLSTRLGWSPWIGLPAAVALTTIVAYVVGVPTLRLKGHYLAMATLGFGMIVHIVFREYLSLTGGHAGVTGIPGLPFRGKEIGGATYCGLVWLIVVAVLVFSDNVARSRIGRALRAVHGHDIAASTVGVDIARCKVQVFVLSAAYAAIAGFLYAHFMKFISPQPFDFKFSVELVVMVVLGGAGSVWGGVGGATLVTVLREGLLEAGQRLQRSGEYDSIVFGLILVVIMIFMPAGGAGEIMRRLQTRRLRRIAEGSR